MSFQNFIPNARPRAFCQPFEGQFEIQVNADAPGARARVNKSGKTVHGVLTKTIYGFIISAQKTETAYGAALDIVLEDVNGQSELFLRLVFDSALAAGFLNRVANVDFSRPVFFDIAKKEARAVLFMRYADNQPIPYAYTREHPGARPDWHKTTRGDGRADWDNSAQLLFFANLLNNDIAARIHSAVRDRYGVVPVLDAPGEPSDAAPMYNQLPPMGYDNDLPF